MLISNEKTGIVAGLINGIGHIDFVPCAAMVNASFTAMAFRYGLDHIRIDTNADLRASILIDTNDDLRASILIDTNDDLRKLIKNPTFSEIGFKKRF